MAKNILISFVVFLAFLFALEMFLRASHLFDAAVSWSLPDKVLRYRFAPHSKYWFRKENDHPISGRINNYGWRDRDWSPGKNGNIYRVAVLGDSFVEAFQVEAESTFISIAERNLNQNFDTEIQLMNFGRSDFSQTEELYVLRNQVAEFSPDLVILMFVPGNDISDVRRETCPIPLRPFYKVSGGGELVLDTSFADMAEFKRMSFIYGLRRHSALISLLAVRYNIVRRRASVEKFNSQRPEPASTEKISGPMSLCTANPDTSYLQSYRLNKALIKEMAEYCGKTGAEFMLVTINTDAYLPELEQKYRFISSTFNANFFEDDLRDFAAALDIEYLGLQRVFRESYENTGIPLNWRHWNYHGHRVVASALADRLMSVIHRAGRS